MKSSNRMLIVVAFVLASVLAVSAQRNNPFSANPDVRTAVAAIKRVEPQQPDVQAAKPRVSIESTERRVELTQIYRVGAGDMIYIVLANAPNASGYYTVRADGTIDFPLAGDSPKVAGMTSIRIEQVLASRIKLYRDARLQVKVQEFGSHRINVSGLVERNGERFLQREAMPLFTIKADVGVGAAATKVMLRRSSGASETYDLNDLHSDDVLVYSGDAVEFVK
jgi:protein involved in polysaccharide export with SLBB domain